MLSPWESCGVLWRDSGAHGMWHAACVLAESHAGHRAPLEPIEGKCRFGDKEKGLFTAQVGLLLFYCNHVQVCFLEWTLWALLVIGHPVTY